MAFNFTYDVNGGSGENLVFGDGYLSLDGIISEINGGSGDSGYGHDDYRYLIPKKLNEKYSHLYPTRDGYILKGWSKDKNATKSDYPYDLDMDIMILNNDVYYAVWEADSVRVHIKILLPDGTASDNAGSIGYCVDSPVESYTRYTRISNGVIQFSSESKPYCLFFKYFESGPEVKLSSWTGVSTVSGLATGDIAWQLMMNDDSSDYYVTFVTEPTPQSVYISPQGDIYAKEFLTYTENKIMITPEGYIYANEYIEDPSFKMLNGKLYAKSFNVGMPNEYQ